MRRYFSSARRATCSAALAVPGVLAGRPMACVSRHCHGHDCTSARWLAGERAEDLVQRRPAQPDRVHPQSRLHQLPDHRGQLGRTARGRHAGPPSRGVQPRQRAGNPVQDPGYLVQPRVIRHGCLDDVEPDAGLELGQRASRDRPPVVDDDDLVGQLVGFFEVMRGEQDAGAAGRQAADRVPHLAAADRVQAGGRLVQQQQARRADEAGTKVQAAPLTAGVSPAPAVGHLTQAQLLDHGARRTACRQAAMAEQPRRHFQVLPAGHGGLDGRVLAGQPDLPAHARSVPDDVLAEDPQFPGVGPDERGDRADERCLARPVRAEHREYPPGRRGESEPVQRGHLAEPHGQVAGRQQHRRRIARSRCCPVPRRASLRPAWPPGRRPAISRQYLSRAHRLGSSMAGNRPSRRACSASARYSRLPMARRMATPPR